MIDVFVFFGIIVGLAVWLRSCDYKNIATFVVNSVIGGLLGGLLGSIVSLVFSAIGWFISMYWPAIVLSVALLGVAAFMIVNRRSVRLFGATAYEVLRTQVELLVAHIKLSDRSVLRFTVRQTQRLIAIAPEFEWMDIRTSISEIGNRHIPSLLRERKSLRSAIRRVQGVLRRVAWQKLDRKDFEKANARRSAQNIEALVVRLQKNEDDLKEALDTFRHLEADLALATVDTYKRDEIKKQLRGLVSRIEQNAVAVDEACTETDDYAQGRIRRLTE